MLNCCYLEYTILESYSLIAGNLWNIIEKDFSIDGIVQFEHSLWNSISIVSLKSHFGIRYLQIH